MSSILFLTNCDLSESFKSLMNDSFIRVQGVLVEKTSSGYIVFGTEVKSVEEVERIIGESKRGLEKSIK